MGRSFPPQWFGSQYSGAFEAILARAWPASTRFEETRVSPARAIGGGVGVGRVLTG